jgi:hypothetical protein
MPVLNVWKNIDNGKYGTEERLRSGLSEAGVYISATASDILSKVHLQKHLIHAELVRISVSDLGFNKMATVEQVYQAARRIGLGLCYPEFGVHARLNYLEQPVKETLFLASVPVIDSDGEHRVFCLGRDSHGLTLGTHYGHYTNIFWLPEFEIIFAKAK